MQNTVSEGIPFYQPLEAKISELSGVEQKVARYVSEHYLEDITLNKIARELYSTHLIIYVKFSNRPRA